jgi:hypothetical protein
VEGAVLCAEAYTSGAPVVGLPDMRKTKDPRMII